MEVGWMMNVRNKAKRAAATPAGARRRRRSLRALLISALMVACAGPLAALPAHASTGYVEIAVQGPNYSLTVYWQADGGTTWHSHQVAGANTTFASPVLEIQPNGNAAIVTADVWGGLHFYWGPVGSGTGWHSETVAPADSVCPECTPAFGTQRSLSGKPAPDVVIVASGGAAYGDEGLYAYTQPNGGTGWSSQIIPGTGVPSDENPSAGSYQPTLTVLPDNTIVVASAVYKSDFGFYRLKPGSTTWTTTQVLAEDITEDNYIYDVVAIGAQSNGTIDTTWVNQTTGALQYMTNAEGSSTWNLSNAAQADNVEIFSIPSLAVTTKGVEILTTSADDCLYALYHPSAAGTSWSAQQVSCTDSGSYATLAAQPDNGGLVIASDTQKGLLFYWQGAGSTVWHAETVDSTPFFGDFEASMATSPSSLY
jgi:hypothetical protein